MKKYLFPLVLTSLIALAGCGEKKAAVTGQAAVKVGADTVSVELLNHELKKLGELSEMQTQQATKEVLNALVDQVLLKEAAVGAKLEDKQEVQLKLDAARNRILAEAYIEHLTASLAKPSEEEIKTYFDAHPELFADRQIFNLQELNIEVNESNIQTVQAQLSKSHNLNEFAAWLKSQGIPVRGRQLAKPAEQLPPALVEKLRAAKVGESITSVGIDSLNLIILAGISKQPVSLEQAKPAIERYLTNTKKKEMVESELKSRREQGKIEYLPPYQMTANDTGAASNDEAVKNNEAAVKSGEADGKAEAPKEKSN